MTHFKLLAELERDIRNQVRISNMLRLNRRQKLMVYANTHPRQLALILFFLILGIARVFAEDLKVGTTVPNEPMKEAKVYCPDPGVKCKVLFLTQQEEQMLMTQNGILDTAAQGRSLDLGQFSVYLKTRIGSAPQGEVKPVEQPKPAQPAEGPKP